MTTSPPRNVVVVIGVAEMGISIARRLGHGRTIILANKSSDTLDQALTTLTSGGHVAVGHQVDIGDRASVVNLAHDAVKAGHVDAIVHTAGVSPVTSTVDEVWLTDLIGTANVIEAFLEVASPGTSMVCISSMAGHTMSTSMSQSLTRHLAQEPVPQLLEHPDLQAINHPGLAYATAKRATHLRVQAMASAYGLRGARINSISPGILSTWMAKAELQGASGDMMRAAVAASAARRSGTPDDIAAAVAFLCSHEASFITGTDLLVDGGATSSGLWDLPKEK